MADHTNPTRLDPRDLVGERAIVKMHHLVSDTSAGIGRVISYCDAPTYEIEQADGTRKSWRADLIKLAPASTAIAFLQTMVDVARRPRCEHCGRP